MHAYKKPLTVFFLLYILTNPLQAANILDEGDDQKEGFSESTQPQKQSTVRDHTLLNNNNVNYILDNIEDVKDDLTSSIWSINTKLVATSNQSTPLILGAVLQHEKNNEHHQYLIANTGLLSETTQPNAVKRVHKKHFHLIKATPGHVILQLLEWLQISEHYSVTALHTNKPICRNCQLIADNLWEKKLPTNEKGCFNLPFPLFDEVPILARQYINIHFHLPFVQKLLVPMMGYISKEKLQKTIQQKDQEMAAFIASMQTTKDEQIAMLNSRVKNIESQLNEKSQQLNNKNQQTETLNNQLNEKNEQITTLKAQVHQKNKQLNHKKQRIKTLNNQLNKKQQIKSLNKQIKTLRAQDHEKNQKINNYRALLLKDIVDKVNTLQKDYDLEVDNIDIENENSVKSFVQKATAKTKEGCKQLNEDIQILRKWHAKYKGNNWKDFETKNNDGAYWGHIYGDIQKKLALSRSIVGQNAVFFSILESLKMLLATNEVDSSGTNETFDQNSLYLLEIDRMRDKLKIIATQYLEQDMHSWRWLE